MSAELKSVPSEAEALLDDTPVELSGAALARVFVERAKLRVSLEAAIPVDNPELADPETGMPLRVWVTPVTPAQRDQAARRATHRKSGRVNEGDFAVWITIMKARDRHGALLFTAGQHDSLSLEMENAVFDRIAKAALGVVEDADLPEDADLEKP